MALELGNSEWRLGFTTGLGQKARERTPGGRPRGSRPAQPPRGRRAQRLRPREPDAHPIRRQTALEEGAPQPPDRRREGAACATFLHKASRRSTQFRPARGRFTGRSAIAPCTARAGADFSPARPGSSNPARNAAVRRGRRAFAASSAIRPRGFGVCREICARARRSRPFREATCPSGKISALPVRDEHFWEGAEPSRKIR
jgi:hypothetical protein